MLTSSKQAAADALDQLGQKFGLAHRRVSKGDIGRQIFNQDLALQRVLHLIDVARHDGERRFVVAQRQKVVEVGTVGHAPGQMLGNQVGFEARADLAQALEVSLIKPGCAAERQANAVNR